VKLGLQHCVLRPDGRREHDRSLSQRRPMIAADDGSEHTLKGEGSESIRGSGREDPLLDLSCKDTSYLVQTDDDLGTVANVAAMLLGRASRQHITAPLADTAIASACEVLAAAKRLRKPQDFAA
jgi:hypothetical protein